MKKILFTLLIMLAALTGFAQQEYDSIADASKADPTVVVGAIGGTVDVSALGGAVYTIPIQVPEGIAGMQPNLSIVYNSQSGNGLLGWGWNLGGLSAITRVSTTLYHDGFIHGVNFSRDMDDRDALDRFALDGQRLMVVNGLPDGDNGCEYRKEIDDMSKVVSYTEISGNGGLFGHGVEVNSYFKVWTSDGLIMEYGRTIDSKMIAEYNSDIATWLLNRVEDRNGNYMNYHYGHDGNCYYLDNIEYTLNSSAELRPAYKIKFEYGNRPDVEKRFIGNYEFDQSKLLKSIIIINKDETETERVLWQYDFVYEGGSGNAYYKYLKEISFTCGNEKYGNTVIDWGKSVPANFYLREYEFLNHEDGWLIEGEFVGDFNGDGYDDIVTAETYSDNNPISKARVFLNRGDDVTRKQIFELVKDFDLSEHISWIYIVDFDGDGLDDIMFSNRERRVGFEQNYLRDKVFFKIFLTRKNEDGSLYFLRYTTPHDDYKIWSDVKESVIMGDFFGENRSGFVLQFQGNSKEAEESVFEKDCIKDSLNLRTSNCYYIRYDRDQNCFVQDMFSETLSGTSFFVADYDGDGRDEILHCDTNEDHNSARVVRLSRNDGGGHYRYSEICNELSIDNWLDCFPGDFNGDGHSDALFHFDPDDSDGEWRIYLFKGTTFESNSYRCDVLNSNGNYILHSDNYYTLENKIDSKNFLKVGDFNGDGSCDIMYPTGRNNESAYFCYGPIIDNTNSGNYPFSYLAISFNAYFHSLRKLSLGYFVGNESLQFMNDDGSSHLFPLPIKYIPPTTDFYTVKNITDGMGNKTDFSYDYLLPTLTGGHEDDFFTLDETGADRSKNIFSIALPMRALKKVDNSNVSIQSPVISEEYRYKNILSHTQGHGLLGFVQEETRSLINDNLVGSVVKEYSSEIPGNKCLIAKAKESSFGKDNNLITKTTFRYSLFQSNRNEKTFMLLPQYELASHYNIDNSEQFIKKTYILNDYQTDTEATGSYDNFVRLTQNWQCVSDDDLNILFSVIPWCYRYYHSTEFEYDDNPDNWVINRPKSKLETCSVLGSDESVKSLTVYSYNARNPFLPEYVTVYPSGIESDADLATTTKYEYNEVGQLTAESLYEEGRSEHGFKTMYGYSDDFRFLEKQTVEYDQSHTMDYETTYTYDPLYGYMTSETDANSLTTQFGQDPLGLLSKQVNPDQTSAIAETRWVVFGDSYAPGNATYYSIATQYGVDGTQLGEARTYYDAKGRVRRSMTYGLEQAVIFVDTEYDSEGRISRVSDPYFQWTDEDDILWTYYKYDIYGRTTKTTLPDRTSQEVQYNGLTVSTTANPAPGSILPVQTTSQTVNVMGWTKQSVDANGTPVNYSYYPDGALEYTQIGDDENTRVSMEYDKARNRTLLNDPDYGETTSLYNAFGQLIHTQNPKNTLTDYEYDNLGRMKTKTEKAEDGEVHVTEWTYSNENGEKGLLKSVSYDNGFQAIGYGYDELNRLQSIKESFDGVTYGTLYTYEDNTGRLSTTTYPTSYLTKNVYSQNGHLVKVCDEKGNALWQLHEKNAYGQILACEMGSGIYGCSYEYDDMTHTLKSQTLKDSENILQSFSYHYDDFRNLDARNDNVHGMKETFQYDQLNRLVNITLDGNQTGVIKYDSYGRMRMKEADGRMVFDAAAENCYLPEKPHALREAVMNVNPFNAAQQDVTYTMFDKVKTIRQDRHTAEFTYGFDQQRIRMEIQTAQGPEVTKTYVGNCEYIDEQSSSSHIERTYLSGPMGVFAVYQTSRPLNGKDVLPHEDIYYINKDHLGSWTAILDDEGEALQQFSYDAWGNSRDPYTWTGTNTTRCMFDRGFTGHEMLYDFGLINMNGRCYDPVMSSFLSVDRYVQDPSNSQNFNRYSYCLNNPLKYVDPSGWRMKDPYNPFSQGYGLGCHVALEPRDFRDGSAFMTSWTLFGGGDGSLGAGGGGGGSSTVPYGFAVNNPQYTVEQQCSLIRNWQKNPSWINKWMMQKAGLSDINRGEVYVNGIRNTYLSWEYNGVSHTASVENEYVGGRGLWGQTVSDIGGRGSYMPPGYKGVMPDGTTTFNRTYETIGTDPGVLRGIGDGIRSLTLAAVDFEKASKTVKVLGKGITHASYLGDAISLEIAWHNYRVNRTYENKARLIVTAIGIGVNGLDFFVPGLGTVCSIAVFAIDADGGFDNFYYKYGRE